MNHRALVSFMAAILLLQPLAVVVSLPHMIGRNMAEIESQFTVAQEPGSRLEPDEYWNHVPVLIDESSDWTEQGWPGDGTEGNPYVIAGLRIHYDIGVPLVQILNQDVHFVIRDCMLIQNSSIRAVEFINTTHGVIEFTSIYSEDEGIFCHNANNTALNHVFAESTAPSISMVRTLYLDSSLLCDISNSYFSSVNYRALCIVGAHNLTLSSNTITGMYYSMEHFFSNYTTCNDNEFPGPDTAIAIWSEFCHYATFRDNRILESSRAFFVMGDSFISVEGCYMNSITATEAFFIWSSLNVSVVDNDIIAPNGMGAWFQWCHYAEFSGNSITTTNTQGLYWEGCDNSSILGNTISYTGTYGIELNGADDVLISENRVEETGGVGIHLDASHNVTIAGCEILNTGSDSIRVSSCNNTIIDSNRIDRPGMYDMSIYVDDSYIGEITNNKIGNQSYSAILFPISGSGNWTIADNTFKDYWGGVMIHGNSFDIDFLRNHGENLANYMVYYQGTPDSEIINNTVRHVSGWPEEFGIALISGCDNCRIEGNTIEDAKESIRVGGDNITIVNNQILNSRNYGISIDAFSDNIIIDENTIINTANRGIEFSTAYYPQLHRNIIRGASEGIRVYDTDYGHFENNNLTDCGFYFPARMSFQDYNHSFSANFVNGKPFYYSINTDGLNLDGDNYGQIILVNCTNSIITDGDFNKVTIPVSLFFGDNIDISNIASHYNLLSVNIDSTTNVTLTDSLFTGSGGVEAYFADEIIIANVTVAHGPGSFYIADTLGFTISDCSFQNVSQAVFAIDCVDSYYGVIEGNSIQSFDSGIYLNGVQDTLIHDNEFKWGIYGIYCDQTANCNLTFNDFHDNQNGAYIEDSSNWRITNNTFLANDNYGLRLVQFTNPIPFISENYFANWQDNGVEDISFNFWDDGSTGNYWHDYTGTPTYLIAGGGGSFDRWPMLYASEEPIINEPADVEYAEFSEGNEIAWFVLDDNLRNWKAYIDSQLWDEDAWNYQDITVNIDGLSYGQHLVEIIVWDLSGNSVTDSVNVQVYDDTDPTIDTPANTIAFEDGLDQVLVWEAFDHHPATYTIYINDNEATSHFWTSGEISFNIDGLMEGLYTITIVIFDIDGNSAADSVDVRVIDDNTSPTIDNPDDVIFIYGTTGNSITWKPEDEYPSHYEIALNVSIYDSGDWGGSRVVLDLDGLEPGDYTFTLTVYDGSGLSASDSVNVTVIPLFPTTIIGPADYTLLLIAAAIGGGIIVAVVVVLYIRKRRQEA